MVVFGVPQKALCITIDYSYIFSGEITRVWGGVTDGPSFVVGDPFFGLLSYTYDSDAIATHNSPSGNSSVYSRPFNYMILFKDYFLYGGFNRDLSVSNGSEMGVNDSLYFLDGSPQGPFTIGSGLWVDDFWMQLLYNSSAAFNDTSLPIGLNMDQMCEMTLGFGILRGYVQEEMSINGRITSITPVPTPEPSTIFLLGAGLAGLARFRKRILK